MARDNLSVTDDEATFFETQKFVKSGVQSGPACKKFFSKKKRK